VASARGFANHSLYMAQVQLAAWRERVQDTSDSNNAVIDAAFAPAVRLHLLDAYGWFLLAMLRVSSLPATPPHCVSELPAQHQGLAVSAEIEEYARLELSGWLADLQSPIPAGVRQQQKGVLAAQWGHGYANYEMWIEAFAQLFTRMGDISEEY